MSDPWLTLNVVLPATIAVAATAGALAVAAANGRFGRRAPAPAAGTPTGRDQEGAQPPIAARGVEEDAAALRSAAQAEIAAAVQKAQAGAAAKAEALNAELAAQIEAAEQRINTAREAALRELARRAAPTHETAIRGAAHEGARGEEPAQAASGGAQAGR